MNTKPTLRMLALAGLLLLTINLQFATAQAQGTAFTYQGQLQNNGSPAYGTYNLTFSLFNTNINGVAVAEPVTNNAVVITNGLFTVLIDFGPGAFTGQAKWLQIGVATNGSSTFANLTPRQELTPAPYAVYAESANATNLVGTIPEVNLSGVALLAGGNAFTGNQTVNGGNVGIDLTSPQAQLDVSGTFRAANSAGAFQYIGYPAGPAQTAILGQFSTSDTNYPLLRFYRQVGGNLMDIGEDGSGNFGLFGNTVELMTVQAGGNVGIGTNAPSQTLEVNGNAQIDGTISATTFSGRGSGLTGLNAANLAGAVPAAALTNAWAVTGNTGANPANGAFVGTADNNPLEMHVNGQRALRLEPTANTPNLIGGYSGNLVTNGVYGAVIAGGGRSGNPQIIGGNYSSILGGIGNAASGVYSMAMGVTATATNYASIAFGDTTFSGGIDSMALGSHSVALGNISTAMGFYSQALNDGTFVWADSTTSTPFSSTGPNQFLIRATGGVGINKNNPATALDVNGTVTATGFAGPGSGLTALNATNLTGTVPSANLSGVALLTGGNTFTGNQIVTTGSVGIGTTTPGKQLELSGSVAGVPAGGSIDSSVLFRVLNTATDGTESSADVAGIGFGNNSTREAIVGASYGYDFLDFYVAGVLTSPAMRILGNGNLGIGTNAPAAKLEVNGNAQIDGTVAASALRAPNAGINTSTFAFIQRAVATNTVGDQTIIYNPVCNGNPNSILIVTHNYSADTNSTSQYNTKPVGVYYNGANWEIYNEDDSAMALGRAFNVMVINP
jgi:hypothetical protein